MLEKFFDQKIALFSAIMGILLLLFLEVSFQPEKIEIGNISINEIESTVLVKGKIDWIKNFPTVAMFGLNDGNRINAVIFSPNSKNLKLLKRNNFVKVTGKIKFFNGKIEIVAEEVDPID